MPPSVLLYGDFAPGELATSLRSGLEQLGSVVVPFDTRKIRDDLSPYLANRVGHRLSIRSYNLRCAGSRLWNQRLLGTAIERRPDILLVVKGELLMPDTLREIKKSGTRVFIFHPDNPFPGHPASRPEFMASAAESDAYFVWSSALADELRVAGVSRVEYLPFAWDPSAFSYVPMSSSPQFDVVFIGGWDKERENWLDPVAHHFDLRIWGPLYWGTRTRRRSLARRCWMGGAVRGTAAAHIIADSKIVLNILRTQHRSGGAPTGVIMRTFEVPGAGGFLLSTRSPDATAIFAEGIAGAYFGTADELMRKIAYFLGHDHERRRLAARAHSLVNTHHQYKHRMQVILDVWEEMRGSE